MASSNDLKTAFSGHQIPSDSDFSNLIDLAVSGEITVKNVTDMNSEINNGIMFNTSLQTANSPFPSGAFYYQVLAGNWGRIRQIAYSDVDLVKIAMRISIDNGVTWSSWDYTPIVDDTGLLTYGSNDTKIKVADDTQVTHNSSDDGIIFGGTSNNIFQLRAQLKNTDDLFNMPAVKGFYEATNINPANNPWGATIWGDMLKLNSSIAFIDNVGNLYTETANTNKWDKKVSENTDNNFHGNNVFDIAPTDKSTGNHYITKTDVGNAIEKSVTDMNKETVPGIYFNNNYSNILNSAPGITSGFYEVLSDATWERIRQTMWHDLNGALAYTRTSSDNGTTWSNWVAQQYITSSDTSSRPSGMPTGYEHFDTTLNKPIWYNGSNWVDSTGTTV